MGLGGLRKAREKVRSIVRSMLRVEGSVGWDGRRFGGVAGGVNMVGGEVSSDGVEGGVAFVEDGDLAVVKS